ncbi:MAG TPA: lipid A export permease/ATP-binding protein MsbA [Geobacteraceae bacterium]|nr:lipid A export permease/ATP-binding protein MsbA [Geobacteraceae bacterium]
MKSFKRVLKYSRRYWRRILVSVIASMGVGGMDGAFAYLVDPLLKRIFTEKDMTVFTLLPIGIILVFVTRGLCRFVNDYFIRTAGQLAIQDIRNTIYKNTMGLGLRFFNNHPTGVLMSRVLNDVSVMQEGIANVITGLFRDGFGAVFLLGVIFYRNWQLAIIAFLVIPITVYPAQKIGRKIKKLSGHSLGKIGDISSIIQQIFSGIKVVKAFGLEQTELARFEKNNRDYYGYVRRSIKYEALSSPIMEMITSLGIAAVIWYGGNLVLQGKMTAPEFFSFITAMVLVYSPVKRLINSYNTVQRSLGAAERVFELIDEKPEILDSPDAIGFEKAEGKVELCDVSFSYNDNYVLKNINFRTRKGEVIAFVGPSGGGKTTLASLIPRFYDVTSGAVLIDGTDVRNIKLQSLLRQVALVDQETILFNDSIGNNIKYGKPEAGTDEVEAAARAAFAHDFIEELPEGYDTVIGDRGVRLSGGQRQRICIARAILKDAPILILDEATSALDTESEQMVQNALNNLMSNRTTFVIAHRLSTILHADKIIVIDRGEIIETGTHQELLEHGGLYRKLYEMQFA